MEVLSIMALIFVIWWIYYNVGPLIGYLRSDPIDQMAITHYEQADSRPPGPEPNDLDDQSGYCEHCGRLMPSRDGQCVTCGSVVHAG